MAKPLPKRTPGEALAELEAAVDRREFHRLTPGDTVGFSNKVPLPPSVPRGPYTKPTRAMLTDVEAGLRRVLDDLQ
ncbi:hypothetical protein [Streptomyces sp. ISL-100]|uniref:hypothetical protein n=1 Tax=Streptomyces sp. ISL-100 TaxID=2819173 RepID=UPI001BE673FD|nr:hypothetical protein [Streptomyces sp. ISL-100]MBT2397944.1 hypothetical protein [Streptomyces sp. ISL-100]